MDELKPCPFCGGSKLYQGLADNDYWVECMDCELVLNRGTQNEAIKAWNSRPSQWISVKDRLPEEGQEVIIYAGKIYIDLFEDESFHHDNYAEHINIAGGCVEEVTHWMEKPEPPEDK